MPRGDKSKYSDKQERKAEHIEESYEKKGVSKDEAEARAWATVNKQSGGGEKAGSGKSKSGTAKRADRKDSARRAVATKQGQSPNSGRASARRFAQRQHLAQRHDPRRTGEEGRRAGHSWAFADEEGRVDSCLELTVEHARKSRTWSGFLFAWRLSWAAAGR